MLDFVKNGAYMDNSFSIISTAILLFFRDIDFIANIHYLHKAPLLFVLSSLVLIICSKLDKNKPSLDVKENFIWSINYFKEDMRNLKSLPWYKNYINLSNLLLIVTAVLVYLYR